ncbi:MAG: hypothetical protein WDN44_01980 [Sphingomonas sp.]
MTDGQFLLARQGAGFVSRADGRAKVSLAVEAGGPILDGKDKLVRVTLSNPSRTPALNAKPTLINGRGERILPAFFSDNCVSSLPDERKAIVRYPARNPRSVAFTLDGRSATPRARSAAR